MSTNSHATSRTQISDLWRQQNRNRWELDAPSLSGEATIRQVEGGFKASIHVTDTEFGMTLNDADEFFESRRDAEKFIKAQMAKISGSEVR